MSPAQTRKYWFPAKRYGWGWGPPVTWQGWVVTGGWLLAVLAGAVYLNRRGPLPVAMFVVAMIALLMLICSATGEPPRWRNKP